MNSSKNAKLLQKVCFIVIIVISEYVYMYPIEKKLVKINLSVGQIANSEALQPSNGKNYNVFILTKSATLNHVK